MSVSKIHTTDDKMCGSMLEEKPNINIGICMLRLGLSRKKKRYQKDIKNKFGWKTYIRDLTLGDHAYLGENKETLEPMPL